MNGGGLKPGKHFANTPGQPEESHCAKGDRKTEVQWDRDLVESMRVSVFQN